ncbi:MAG: cell division protein ZipA [Chromatiales bacterium]
MTTLRVILLIIGVLIIAGVWLWSRRQQPSHTPLPRPLRTLRRDPAHERSPISGEEDDDAVDYARTLADLSGLMRETRADRDESARGSEADRRRPTRRRHPRQMDLTLPEGADSETAAALALPERIVALYIRAPDGAVFEGPSILRALVAVDMHFGEMSIFHHYGVGQLLAPQPLFSAANMFEPGTLNPAEMQVFTTGGIALFMQLPCLREASLVFELLLNTAQRLAELLGGEVLDDTRQPLTSRGIEQLRELLRPYDHA